MRPLVARTRWTAWLDRWGGIVPLLLAEFIVWLGFGALLPVLPLYFTEQGVDLALLGVVIAAWPAARLVGEPIFGWLADRTARVPLMVVGLVATGRVLRAAARLRRPAGVRPPARRGRAGDRAVRPGRPRLPDRRDAARAAGRGVRPVRRGADGRAAARAGDRRRSGPRGSAASRSCSSSVASRAWLAAIPIALRVREGTVRDPPGAVARRRPSSRPRRRRRAPGRGRRSPPTRSRAPRPRRADRLLEPRPRRGPRHQRRRLLRRRHVRGHLEPVPDRPRRRPRPRRADVRDVRAAGPAPVAVRRPAGRSAGALAFIVIGSILPAVMGLAVHAA